MSRLDIGERTTGRCPVQFAHPGACSMGSHDSLAEWSKALASGASPQGRGFEPHSCHSWIASSTSWLLAHHMSGCPNMNDIFQAVLASCCLSSGGVGLMRRRPSCHEYSLPTWARQVAPPGVARHAPPQWNQAGRRTMLISILRSEPW